MTYRLNQYEQPIGGEIANWSPRQLPTKVSLLGQYCKLEQLDIEKHGKHLFQSYQTANDKRDWTYLPFELSDNYQEFCCYLSLLKNVQGQWHYAVLDKASNKALGTLALMRADNNNGVIEVGFINFSPLLQRTRIATESHFILMSYVFGELSYRRYEWKCDSLNLPSKKAAERLGFKYEGLFRQAIVYKSRTRDTIWFSIIDKEWPLLKGKFQQWLDPNNFDQNGLQINKLSQCITF